MGPSSRHATECNGKVRSIAVNHISDFAVNKAPFEVLLLQKAARMNTYFVLYSMGRYIRNWLLP